MHSVANPREIVPPRGFLAESMGVRTVIRPELAPSSWWPGGPSVLLSASPDCDLAWLSCSARAGVRRPRKGGVCSLRGQAGAGASGGAA